MRASYSETKYRALVVVGKAPQPGLVKTRLCPFLSPDEAAALYDCFLADIVTKFERCRSNGFWIAYAPGGEDYFARNFPEVSLLRQRGKDLGERLHHIFLDLFELGYQKVLVADSDSLTVSVSSVDQAYKLLTDGCDLVLGPSTDGGYYLVGLKSAQAELFEGIPWSTEFVMERTMERAAKLGLKVALLALAYDVDVEDDLKKLWNDFRSSRRLQERSPRTYAYLKRLLGDSGYRSYSRGLKEAHDEK